MNTLSLQEAADASAQLILLELDGLTKDYVLSGGFFERLAVRKVASRVRAVDGVSFGVRQGSTFGLVGESGCGKSTIANLLVGLIPPTAGAVRFAGTDLSTLKGRRAQASFRRRVQMIFQDPYASLNPRWRVRDIIAEPLRVHGLATSRQAIYDRVDELLDLVRLNPADSERFPHQFSGGQRQRLSIARALASEPDLLICDEPTSALDVSIQAQILNLMKDLQSRLGLTYVFISHNLSVVSHITDHVGVMYLGRLVEWQNASNLFAAPRHPYTRMLLEAIPSLETRNRERPQIRGEVASPINPPPGCHFHPRCPFAQERCRREVPTVTVLPQGGEVRCHFVDEIGNGAESN